jgi:hypothetical protein
MRRKSTLILLGLILCLAVLLVLGGVATAALGRTARSGWTGFVVMDADGINRIAERIAYVEMPPGYAPEVGVRGGGFALATYTPGENQGHLTLAQIPAWIPVDEREMIRFVNANIREDSDTDQGADTDMEVTVIEERAIDLGDHSVFYSIAESTDDEGLAFRSVFVLYPRRNGKVVLQFQEPIDRWDDARAHALLTSLR